MNRERISLTFLKKLKPNSLLQVTLLPLRIIDTVLSSILAGLIRIYQKYISPHTGKNCRFVPTCSNYTVQSIKKFGFLKGGIVSAWRIIRCNPLVKGGYDPVPEKWYQAFIKRRSK